MADGNAQRARGGLSIVVGCVPMLAVAAALAAAPVRGGSYRGALTGSRSAIHVSFRVSSSGTAVSHVTVSALPLYCSGKPPPSARITFFGAPVDSHGTFTAKGADKIGVGPLKGSVIAKLKLTGTFATGRSESGVITTTLIGGSTATCSGHSSYRTKAS
jgi:hypothetical protein